MRVPHPTARSRSRLVVRRLHDSRRLRLESLERRLALSLNIEDFTDDFYQQPVDVPYDRTRAAFDSFDTDPLTIPGGDTDADPNTTLGPDEFLIPRPNFLERGVRIDTNRFDNLSHFLTIVGGISPSSYEIDFVAIACCPADWDPMAKWLR
jgi:hypothetical protein